MLDDTYLIQYSAIKYASPSGSGFQQTCGPVYQTNPENEPGRLISQFPLWNFGDYEFPYHFDYLILDTDYENYAAVLGCEETFGPTAAVLTREDHPNSLFVRFSKKQNLIIRTDIIFCKNLIKDSE